MQPAKPRKGASPAEIKAYVAECLEQSTPAERAEYDATGADLQAIFARCGMLAADGSLSPEVLR